MILSVKESYEAPVTQVLEIRINSRLMIDSVGQHEVLIPGFGDEISLDSSIF